MNYFDMGMVASEARRRHENELTLLDTGNEILDSGRTNPSRRTVAHWYREWKILKDELRHPLDESVKALFEEYFGYGMGPRDARHYIRNMLLQCGKSVDVHHLPSQRLTLHWFKLWKQANGAFVRCSPYEETKKKFLQYFHDGMSVHMACVVHEEKLKQCGLDSDVKCKIKNPPDQLVAFWHQEWKINSKKTETQVFGSLRFYFKFAKLKYTNFGTLVLQIPEFPFFCVGNVSVF